VYMSMSIHIGLGDATIYFCRLKCVFCQVGFRFVVVVVAAAAAAAVVVVVAVVVTTLFFPLF
jgi:hypothetical protein